MKSGGIARTLALRWPKLVDHNPYSHLEQVLPMALYIVQNEVKFQQRWERITTYYPKRRSQNASQPPPLQAQATLN